jgi:hypothetical protein
MGAASGAAGLLLSYHAELPSGPCIVLVCGGAYIVSVLFGTRDGIVTRRLHAAFHIAPVKHHDVMNRRQTLCLGSAALALPPWAGASPGPRIVASFSILADMAQELAPPACRSRPWWGPMPTPMSTSPARPMPSGWRRPTWW